MFDQVIHLGTLITVSH